VKAIYKTGPVSYASTSYNDVIDGWVKDPKGIGPLDYLEFNVYYSDAGQFRDVIARLHAAFQSRLVLSEWNVDGGLKGQEKADADKVGDALNVIAGYKIPSYFYTYRDENPREGTLGVLKPDGNYKTVWSVLTSA
jgi:hypothetical protein